METYLLELGEYFLGSVCPIACPLYRPSEFLPSSSAVTPESHRLTSRQSPLRFLDFWDLLMLLDNIKRIGIGTENRDSNDS